MSYCLLRNFQLTETISFFIITNCLCACWLCFFAVKCSILLFQILLYRSEYFIRFSNKRGAKCVSYTKLSISSFSFISYVWFDIKHIVKSAHMRYKRLENQMFVVNSARWQTNINVYFSSFEFSMRTLRSGGEVKQTYQCSWEHFSLTTYAHYKNKLCMATISSVDWYWTSKQTNCDIF